MKIVDHDASTIFIIILYGKECNKKELDYEKIVSGWMLMGGVV